MLRRRPSLPACLSACLPACLPVCSLDASKNASKSIHEQTLSLSLFFFFFFSHSPLVHALGETHDAKGQSERACVRVRECCVTQCARARRRGLPVFPSELELATELALVLVVLVVLLTVAGSLLSQRATSPSAAVAASTLCLCLSL